jgi:hypothetical protein
MGVRTVAITEEDVQTTNQWLKDKGVIDRGCAACGGHDLEPVQVVVMRVMDEDGAKIEAGVGLAAVAVSCSTCGHLLFFSSVKMGMPQS